MFQRVQFVPTTPFLQIDPTYVPPDVETKQVYGINLRQNRNDAKIDAKLFTNIVTENKEVCYLPTDQAEFILSLF